MTARSSADVREGGQWSPRQRAKNDLLYAAALGALALGHLPRAALLSLGRFVGRAIHFSSPALRHIAERQIARALPERDAVSLARACFVELGAQLADALATTARGDTTLLEIAAHDRDVLAAAVAEGRGVVLASAHLGPFERVARTLAAHAPLSVVARESYDPRLMRIYARLRPYDAIYRGAAGAGVRMLRALRSGRVLGIPMDLRTRAESVAAPFLGDDEAPTAVGPARLALRTGARVLVATAERTHGQALAVTVTPIDTRDLSPSSPADEIELTRRINHELSARIVALPTMWPWMHARSAQEAEVFSAWA